MPFSQRQIELIDKHLFADESDGEQPTTTLKLSRRDLRFLLQAIQFYHDTCCPGLEQGAECAMLVWGEDVHSGALESSCRRNCQGWIDDLLSEEVLASFPARGAGK